MSVFSRGKVMAARPRNNAFHSLSLRLVVGIAVLKLVFWRKLAFLFRY